MLAHLCDHEFESPCCNIRTLYSLKCESSRFRRASNIIEGKIINEVDVDVPRKCELSKCRRRPSKCKIMCQWSSKRLCRLSNISEGKIISGVDIDISRILVRIK